MPHQFNAFSFINRRNGGKQLVSVSHYTSEQCAHKHTETESKEAKGNTVKAQLMNINYVTGRTENTQYLLAERQDVGVVWRM